MSVSKKDIFSAYKNGMLLSQHIFFSFFFQDLLLVPIAYLGLGSPSLSLSGHVNFTDKDQIRGQPIHPTREQLLQESSDRFPY